MTTTTTTPATAVTEQLSTGWEPEVPVTDSIVRRYLFAWARMCEAFAAGGRTEWTPEFAASDHGRPASFYTSATLLRPPASPAGFEGVVDAVEGFYPAGSGEIHLWSSWPTPDLRHRGWRLVGHPPLLVRPPAALVPLPEPAGVRIDEVTDSSRLAAWEKIAIEGYPLDELEPVSASGWLDRSVLDDPRLSFTLGYDDPEPTTGPATEPAAGSTPVSVGALFTDLVDPTAASPGRAREPGTDLRDLNVFSLGVTMPAARGKGHWLAHAVHRLRRSPGTWSAGVFSDYSRSPAERLGFVPITRFTLWTRRV